MPIPPSVTSRVVQGTYVNSAGVPQRGTITFRVAQPLIATVESWGITPEPIIITLSTSGTFQTSLMASDDIDLFPSGFRYTVQERFQGGYVRSYSVEVPTGADPLDLPSATQYDPGDVGLAIVHSINGLTGIVQISPTSLGAIPLAQKAAANGVASLDSGGKIPISQLPAGTAGVTSVDGRTGVVTLTDLYASAAHSHSYPVTSVNGKTGVVTLTPGDVGAVATSLLGANSGVATLDSGGKLLGAQVPALAITDVFDAASEVAMLALSSAQKGDLARRTDLNKTFVLTATDYTVLSNWKEILSPPDAVFSVNGATGTVTLTAAQVGAIASTARGAVNGVASLDGTGFIPVGQIPSLPASRITSGLIDVLRLPTGATSTTVAIGNHTHTYVPTSEKGAAFGVASLDSAGHVPLAQLPPAVVAVTSVNGETGDVVLSAADVGALATTARGAVNGVASLDSSTLVPVAQIPNISAAKVTSGTLDIARVPTGTSGTTVSLGDHTHTYVPLSEKGAASGVATLDSGTKVTFAQIPTGTSSSSVALGDHAHTGTYVPLASVGSPDGVAPLDSSGLLPSAQIPGLDATKVTTGVFDISRMPTGTSSTQLAIGNHTHGYIATSDKGAASGVAPLDANSQLPSANLTPYVMRGIVLGTGDPIPGDIPQGTAVFRTTGTPWTDVLLEGLWNGSESIPVVLAT